MTGEGEKLKVQSCKEFGGDVGVEGKKRSPQELEPRFSMHRNVGPEGPIPRRETQEGTMYRAPRQATAREIHGHRLKLCYQPQRRLQKAVSTRADPRTSKRAARLFGGLFFV
jgi:hypothetical protein